MKRKNALLPALAMALLCAAHAQPLHQKKTFSRQDSLRGTLGPERTWWDVLHYDISIEPNFADKTISGKTIIRFKVLPGSHTDYMQIDLQQPLVIDSMFYDGKLYINYPPRPAYNEGNVWHVPLPKVQPGSEHSLAISYHGKPKEAVNPPWDGGWIFKKDSKGRPWMTVACQGLGASVWYPCKDHQSDEPDKGATLRITVPDTLVAVGNGHLLNTKKENGLATYVWNVNEPINNYTIIPYIGKYVNFRDTLQGEKGKLDLNYWVLDYDKDAAVKQFAQVKPMLRAFEYWFGPYPFYEDGYQLIEAPHLGMEHQSAVAYGNHFQNGYLGRDLSGTGWGLKWDYIIVHESGHEWFANNITTKDIADMWVHEGFTDYSETLFIEYYYGKEAADAYVQGLRKNIENRSTIIGPYGVNQEGSGDMYYKGANMLHTIRQVINDDGKFRDMLRTMNSKFYHATVTSKQIESFMSSFSGKDLSKIFDQYLRDTRIPLLEMKSTPKGIVYRWSRTVPGFNMPVRFTNGTVLMPVADTWKTLPASEGKSIDGWKVDPNYYIEFNAK